jgi:transposase
LQMCDWVDDRSESPVVLSMLAGYRRRMTEFVVSSEALTLMFQEILPHLAENQRRYFLGAHARMLGYGGVTEVARMAGVDRGTVQRGALEIDKGIEVTGRIRRPGGGRKLSEEVEPELVPALAALVEPESVGDPQRPTRWTSKATRKLALALLRLGFKIGHTTVAALLADMGFSLQAPSKVLAGSHHPDRDSQFRYIGKEIALHQAAGEPVISVDCKKKEMIGDFANGGREWRKAGQPVPVNDHDFPNGVPKAVPYGVYDITNNTGWVSVGTSSDTATFAVNSIRQWWNKMGSKTYANARKLLVTADGGGSNGYRSRLWKKEIAAFAAEAALEITVCHYSPGTSKWNKIEHRLFSNITINWRGRPLKSHDAVVNLIASTTTSTGLRVEAALDRNTYKTGIKISKKETATLPIYGHMFHGEWNYTLRMPVLV